METTARHIPVSLEAPALGCVRGGIEIFSGLDVSARPGSAVLIRGANGVGKSSALLVLAGQIPQSAPTFHWRGAVPESDPRRLMHFVSHQPAVQNGLSVFENLAFWTAVYGARPDRIAHALEVSGLDAIAELPCETLSAGQTRRLALARLVSAPRPVWLLDEPTTALDAAGAEWVRQLVTGHIDRGGVAVIASHLPLGIETDTRVRTLELTGRNRP